MCDRPAGPGWPRPRWRTLYAIVAAAGLAAAATRAALPAAVLRAGMVVAIPAIAAVALAVWVVTNRVALDLTEWCECARGTVGVRVVVVSAPPSATPSAPCARAVERTTLQA